MVIRRGWEAFYKINVHYYFDDFFTVSFRSVGFCWAARSVYIYIYITLGL